MTFESSETVEDEKFDESGENYLFGMSVTMFQEVYLSNMHMGM